MNVAVAVGGAVDADVVHDDDLAAGAALGVEFDAVGALLAGQAERSQGVLGRVGAGAAMAEHERVGVGGKPKV